MTPATELLEAAEDAVIHADWNSERIRRLAQATEAYRRSLPRAADPSNAGESSFPVVAPRGEDGSAAVGREAATVALLALKNVRQFLERPHVKGALRLATPEDRDALGLVLESVGEAMAMLGEIQSQCEPAGGPRRSLADADGPGARVPEPSRYKVCPQCRGAGGYGETNPHTGNIDSFQCIDCLGTGELSLAGVAAVPQADGADQEKEQEA
jgi:hypothetical protein